MLQKIPKALALIFVSVFFIHGQAFALPVTDDYWTLTDLTYSRTTFSVRYADVNFFSGGGSFGFYDMDDETNTLEVLSSSVGTWNEVYFTEGSSGWSAGLERDLSDQNPFNINFGFYFNYGGTTYYTDASLNGGFDPITIDYTPYTGQVNFYLSGSPMIAASVLTNDIAPASVPEPSTMLLLGTGLVGLAGFCRKRSKKVAHS